MDVGTAVGDGAGPGSPARRDKLARELLLVAGYNMAIAFFLAAVAEYSLATNLVFANCIGFSIYGGVTGAHRLRRTATPGVVDGLIGIPLGFAVGFVLAAVLTGYSLTDLVVTHPRAVSIAAATALLFGALGTWHFRDAASVAHAQAEARAERLRRAEHEAAAAHAELARLQAQIEPHFLFNTLSNVVGLIDTAPATARRMLLDLTALLRISLARTRQAEVTLREELDLLRAYLGIMGVRMGSRLQWTIEADEALHGVRLPPLLVQPLVENAIRHGLEPKTAGGRLGVRCWRGDGDLVIEVADEGVGFAPTQDAGVGLANVRARLAACYGEAAGLTLEEAPGGGVRALIHLPLEPACAS